MKIRRVFPLVVALICLALFVALGTLRSPDLPPSERGVKDRVVIAAPIQLLLAGGDRFLAANFEAIRLAATGSISLNTGADDAAFRIRAHRTVAQLNACHEDNYYVGNALLSWGGAPQEGSNLLKLAMECRDWDEFVPFFYGFNELFFNRNAAEARRAYELAAQRSKKNGAVFRKLAIMVAAESLDDAGLALDYLQRERDRASDPELRRMLDERVERLKGLVLLREAQRRYEAQFSRPLPDPADLISSGLLQAFPRDPLRLGYVFEQGEFKLRKLKIDGMESGR